MATVVVVGGPKVKDESSRHWRNALLNVCGDYGGITTCCYAMCCQPCAFGSEVNMLKPKDVLCGGNCMMACYLYSYLQMCCMNGCYHWSVRHAVRRKFGIVGDDMSDLLVVCCCPCCAQCQETNELINHEDEATGGGVTVVVVAAPAPPPATVVVVNN